MNRSSNTEIAFVGGQKIHFDDFEISWVGENRLSEGLCFGSDDGRFRTWADSLNDPVSPSAEAVNGVAFVHRAMAVSTRADVSFILFDETGRGHRVVHDGGAHGVIAISSGAFVAPLGRNGLLTMKPIEGPEQILASCQVVGERTNFYKLVHCAGDGTTDLVVGACRTDGLAILELNSLEDRIQPDRTYFFRGSGVDVVDVCSLQTHGRPQAVAWLGIDRSIHLSKDILDDVPPTSFRIKQLQGKAYSIQHDRGHVFLLTSEAVYMFPDLATRFLSGTCDDGLMVVLSYHTNAIDEISICYGNLLLSINGDIQTIPTQPLLTGDVSAIWQKSVESNQQSVETTWEKTIGREWSSEPNKSEVAA